MAGHHGRDQWQRLTLAATKEGKVTGLKVDLLADLGSYVSLVGVSGVQMPTSAYGWRPARFASAASADARRRANRRPDDRCAQSVPAPVAEPHVTLTVAGALAPAALLPTTANVSCPLASDVAVHVAVITIVAPTLGLVSLAETVHTGTELVAGLAGTVPGFVSPANANAAWPTSAAVIRNKRFVSRSILIG